MDRPASWRRHAIDLAAERPFRIGGAHIDPVSRDVQFAGGSERLQPQTLKVLIALVRRKGEVVTRAELVDSCWDGRIIGDDVINHSISVLRDFAERAGGFTIETVPKAGYRLVEIGRASAWLGRAKLDRRRRFCFRPDPRRGNAVDQPPRPAGRAAHSDDRHPPFDQLRHRRPSALARDTRALALPRSVGQRVSGAIAFARAADDRRSADLIISGRESRQSPGSRPGDGADRGARNPHDHLLAPIRGRSDAERAILPERIGAQVAAALSWTGR